MSKKRFCVFWIAVCTTKQERSPRGTPALGVFGVYIPAYPAFMLRSLIKINANTHDTGIAIALAIALINEKAFCGSCMVVVLIITSPFQLHSHVTYLS